MYLFRNKLHPARVLMMVPGVAIDLFPASPYVSQLPVGELGGGYIA